MMNMMTGHPVDQLYRRAAKWALICLPFYVVVPLLFWAGFQLAGYAADWRAYGLGALGWFIALLLRSPIQAMAAKWPEDKAKTMVGLSSGPLEETTRVILLAATSFSPAWAVSIGQGWAAIEVLFVMINIVVLASLANRTDEKAVQAKQLLAAQGNLQASPAWGIVERIWASAFHIGATLIVAAHPWTVALLIPFHSGLNWVAVRLSTRSLLGTSLFLAAAGLAALSIGLLLL